MRMTWSRLATDKEIGNALLTNFRSGSLESVRVTEEGLAPFKGFTNVIEIGLEGTSVTKKTGVSDADVGTLENLTAMAHMDLCATIRASPAICCGRNGTKMGA